jgi:hypothetical protein
VFIERRRRHDAAASGSPPWPCYWRVRVGRI